MSIAVLATNPTDSNTEGFLPAALRRGGQVLLLTDDPQAHRDAYAGTALKDRITITACDVRDHRAVLTVLDAHDVHAVFSGSDHLQMQAALAADYLGLPGKDWRAAWATKNKAAMRSRLARTGVDAVWSLRIDPEDELPPEPMPFPVVAKPQEGVASENVELCADREQLIAHLGRARARRGAATILVEEFLPGELRTLETLGDGTRRHVLGGFRTRLGDPPNFVEEELTFEPEPDPIIVDQVLAALDALGVGFGICHTEYVVHEGRARLIEVNYRAIGDQCDLLLADLLDIPLFDLALGVHCGDALPPELGRRVDGRARVTYLCASSGGTLEEAPDAADIVTDDVALTYRPMRERGVRAEFTGTNRDYLGVVRARGREQSRVDAAVAAFIAENRWTIR
ncbi:acetyl-CoA carboxylase biotin carboxylase subunit family protein [Microbacterium sp. NPDC058342]|uniref:ATP-grasp domain-containing protein n=1 Tax=Microbacterium sp. NPDC058342 TaxID=3346454 RepID=UPI00366317A5